MRSPFDILAWACRAGLLCASMAGLATSGCSSGDDHPETSGSTNWLQCSSDADCEDYDATCGDDGYCVNGDGERVSVAAETNEPEPDPNASGPDGSQGEDASAPASLDGSGGSATVSSVGDGGAVSVDTTRADGSTAVTPVSGPTDPNPPSASDGGSVGDGGSLPRDASSTLEPEVVPGSTDAGTEPATDAGSTDPCAYLAEPEMKSCETDADCGVVFRRSCCGGSIVGINTARQSDYERLEPACDLTIGYCECQQMLSLAEDDRYAAPTSPIGAECVEGRCRSFVDQSPCGDEVPGVVANGLYDDYCARGEVCVRYQESVDGQRTDRYTCVASACGGSSDCACSEEVCGADFPECFDSVDAMLCWDGQ